jgi:hypothetical protein
MSWLLSHDFFVVLFGSFQASLINSMGRARTLGLKMSAC